MSWVRNLIAFFVAIILIAVGSVAANYAWQLQTISLVAEPVPVQTKVATLASKGPGTAVHLELTEFKFGEPLIEKNGERWECVWLPLLPPSAKTVTPVVFFRSTRIHDQAQLDQLREQKSLRVFVTNTSLQKSVWGAAVSHDFFAKYPKIDFGRLTVAAEPDLDMPLSREMTGKPVVLATNVLLSPTTRMIAWAICGGSFLIGMILIVVLISPDHRVTVTQSVCRVDKSDSGMGVTVRYLSSIPARFVVSEDVKRERDQLMREMAVSSHQYRSAFGMIASVLGVGLGLLLFLGIVGGMLYKSSQAGAAGPATAFGIGSMAACALMLVVYFGKRTLDRNGKFADVIQLCSSGIRWQNGKHVGMAAWSEIARVERVTVDVNRKKQVVATQFGLIGALAVSMGSAGDDGELTRERDTVSLQLQSGDVMYFSSSSLSDYITFAQTIHELHGNEARRRHGGGFDEMITRGISVQGAASNRTMQNFVSGR
jgi:hypothetical protein